MITPQAINTPSATFVTVKMTYRATISNPIMTANQAIGAFIVSSVSYKKRDKVMILA